jgi:uncharacterized membrane protein YccF (DUF307 family)
VVGGTAEQGRVATAKHWAGYGWFMSLGTLFPLIAFLCSYAVHLTLVGAPVARAGYRLGIWLATFGQDPPGKGKLDSRKETGKKKRSIAGRIKPYTPAEIVERRDQPVAFARRARWFVLVGWWLGGIWVIGAWSVFLAPYPFLDTVRSILDELPTVMTLAPVRE